MRSFLKGFLIGTTCICILALAWLCVVRPSLTAHEADALKAEYTQPSPGADSSGAGPLPAEKESIPVLDFAALRADYPDIRAWLTIPCKAAQRIPNTTSGATTGASTAWRAVCFFKLAARWTAAAL